ncbi:DUF2062 domain-containing protein [Sphingobacterium humi]|uniref:DUF2062 domain-containing protein n=1 Tax=Sphingobacterium humi TaxID=1796905 RepID=UPI0031B5CB1B
MALGVFIGIIPAWGFQTFLCLALAAALKWNKALAFLGSNISIPPFIPLIVWLSLLLGGYAIPSARDIPFDFEHIDMDLIKIHLLQYVVGSFLLAIFASLTIGGITYLVLKRAKRKPDTHVE